MSSSAGAGSYRHVRPGLFAALLGLAACGGGGGGSTDSVGASPPPAWTAGIFQPSTHFAAMCQNPRSGTDPISGDAYPDVQGTTLDENNWLRSWSNELYLWYSEIPDVDPATYSTTAAYFDVLKTPATTSTGTPKDHFHFTYTTAQWEQLSQAGADVGYGVDFDLVSAAPPRLVYAAFVWSGYPAAAANISRGAQVLAIDGVDMINGSDVATLNAGLYPVTAGESHVFTIMDPGVSTSRMVTLVSGDETETPVPLVSTIPSSTGAVGYILFNDHIATSEQELINAITQLKSAAVTDLVLDIRYNGGGYLDIASELAYMVAGPGPTAGATFQKQTFNSKYPSTNPVTGSALTPTPFHTTSQGFSAASGTNLPYLGLPRVFVLTGPGTCSASEAIINGLDGVDVQVIQIGTTTCGKPYGFYPQDNCGTTYFSIEFSGDNAKGFGDYADGFSPQNSATPTSALLPGCAVADDYAHQLGDPAEGRLAAALAYRNGQSCPTPPAAIAAPVRVNAKSALHKPFWRENLITHRR
jgi:carboxyl-terminal processing protease